MPMAHTFRDIADRFPFFIQINHDCGMKPATSAANYRAANWAQINICTPGSVEQAV
jgi:hypothetical protein